MALDASIDLRALVREVLREAIAARTAPIAGVQAVSIVCDADLQALIARLAAPGGIEAVRAGSVKYTLAAAQASPLPLTAQVAPNTLEGVISERRLQGMTPGSTIALAASAVVTPLAKDLARRLGLKLERMER
jgi:hypothetical protein